MVFKRRKESTQSFLVTEEFKVQAKTAPFESPVNITGKVVLDRTLYGITYNSTSYFSSLGDKAIRNTFEVEFSLTGTGKIPGNRP